VADDGGAGNAWNVLRIVRREDAAAIWSGSVSASQAAS
jgi:hypothetical protein